MEKLTREQSRETDRHAVEKLGVPSICLMENAGRQVADAACEMIPEGASVLVLCGTGNNGGDGFVAARHLRLRGISVEAILLGKEAKLTPDARTNYDAARNCGVPVEIAESLGETGPQKHSLIVDALLGTGLSGDVREPHASAISVMNDSGIPVLSVDTPSGLDCDTGDVLGVCVKAERTVTFVLPKVGFALADGPRMCGEITVADIGIPPP